MLKKKKILFVVPSLKRAGAQIQLVSLITALDQKIITPHLFTFEENTDQLPRIDQKTIKYYNRQRRFKYDIAPAREMAALIDRENIDVVHCTLQFSLLAGWLATKLAKSSPKLMVAVHTTLNRSLKDDIQEKLIYQWLMRRCDKVIFVCDNQRQFWIKKHSFLTRNSTFVYNGVDVSQYQPELFIDPGQKLLASLSIPKEASVLCCMARFSPEKGHRILLRAFAGLKGNPYLLLLGDGAGRNDIEQLSDQLDVRDRIRFLGNVSDVRPSLAASNMCVLASTAVETFSMAMLESMCMGVPVVATDIGGLSEAVFPGETGDIVPPGDMEGLRDALQKMLNHPDQMKIMGSNGRQLVLDKFSQESMVTNTEKILLA